MMIEHADDPRMVPSEVAEGEEMDAFERGAAERGPAERRASSEEDDPRELDGWTQPESSAQKGALPDEG